MNLNFLYSENGVGYLTAKKTIFSQLYLQVREREQRVLTDEQVARLPQSVPGEVHHKEWRVRRKSTDRFLDYLKKKSAPLQILDIGCGNGWFTHLLASVSKENKVVGLDINRLELEQAARVFQKENLQFVFGDIFSLTGQFQNRFHLITINASVQYFHDFRKLLSLLKSFLRRDMGEIHIIDSPFYKKADIVAARSRSEKYYSDLGFPEMAEHYFHHSVEEVNDFEVLYRPKKSLLDNLSGRVDSPFKWLCYRQKY